MSRRDIFSTFPVGYLRLEQSLTEIRLHAQHVGAEFVQVALGVDNQCRPTSVTQRTEQVTDFSIVGVLKFDIVF